MTKRLAIVMAAGKGTRMKSDRAKVLIEVLGRPMIDYALDALADAGVDRAIAVVGHEADLVERHVAERGKRGTGTSPSAADSPTTGLTLGASPPFSVECIRQCPQLGTGHAVMMCRPKLVDYDGPVLVVAGDSPLMQADSIRALFDEFARSRPACILGTGYKDEPRGLGRIVRDERRQFVGIVEEKDASAEQRNIQEVNLSTYVFNCRDLLYALERLSNSNAQKEYYLTDCPGILRSAGRAVLALDVLAPCESLSINTPEELAVAEDYLRAHPPRRGGSP